MYVYTPGQWALLFFFYCFCGWVWESCYVSAKQLSLGEPGLLHGPLLPIYGSGAIIILFATRRWRTTSGWSIFWVCWPLRRWNMW